ncbi:hypothetical protein [Pseudonocardia sp. NPDC049635]|uniref:hypothetical protein n=1 Tax=Pseudonocardia sp. NPDC049635 TaxID=3155506 RepID=UPI0033F7F6E9
MLTAWSHAGRCRDDGAFAILAGTAPIPASSGKTVRPAQPHRGSPAQPSRLHHRHHSAPARPGDPRQRRPPPRPGQDRPRNPPLPRPLRHPPALPTARNRTAHSP